MMSPPLLIVFGLGILAALCTVIQRNPIHSALFLILTLLSVAISFLSLQAEFLAMIQVIVYAGAIMVLIIFVLLLTTRDETKREALFHRQSFFALLIGLGLLGELVYLLFQRRPILSSGGFPYTLKDFGNLLFKEYVFPFELASILLLVGLVATVVIAKKETASNAREVSK